MGMRECFAIALVNIVLVVVVDMVICNMSSGVLFSCDVAVACAATIVSIDDEEKSVV